MKTHKQSKFLIFTHLSKFFVLFIAFLIILSLANKPQVIERMVPAKNYYQKPETTKIERSIKVITPTPNAFNWTVEKEDEHITKMMLPPDSRMSTAEELFDAMNSYRSAHGVSTLQKSDTLCSIAQNRANEQVANGKLDGHVGFEKYAKEQEEYAGMGEVLFGGSQPQYGVHIVEFGWDRSLTGHREAIQNPSWQYGCGGIADYYAVFIFGSK